MGNKTFTSAHRHVIVRVEEGRAVCPICGARTQQRILDSTTLKDFPLFCKKCKLTSLVRTESLSLRA